MRHLGPLILLTILLCGCSGKTDALISPQPAPRPVSVFALRESDPALATRITGVVGSWKTEELGFEVSGRVQSVIEPEVNVTASTNDGLAGQVCAAEDTENHDGSEVLKPDAGVSDDERSNPQWVARIDPEKYQTAVVSANAQINMLQRQKGAATIELEQVLTSELDAANATLELRNSEFERAKQLAAQNAISKSEYDQKDAERKTAEAKVAQLRATQEAKKAEITSLDAQIDQARAALRDAERDLKDCTIRAPFNGQIARVHVIRGGTVQRGEPVVTLQMMDPVKVEFEVSAKRVREMKYKDFLNVILTRPDGDINLEGVIWTTDSAADPNTRTFTVTVLVRNQLVAADLPADVDRASLVTTRDVWRFISGIVGDENRHYTEKNTIHADDQGEYVWKVINPPDKGSEQSLGPLLNVEKVRVTTRGKNLEFLGAWSLRDVEPATGESFDLKRDFVLGELVLPDGMTEFTGDAVIFEREQWMMRPGDLVRVDLGDAKMASGFYVPIEAINEQSGKHYVFALEASSDTRTVRRVEVKVSDGPNAQKQIQAIGEQPLTAGTQIVLGGTHYLTDGEAVNVASIVEMD